MTGVIYGLVDSETLELRYIGQTLADQKQRLRQHMYNARHHVNKSPHLYTWIRSLASPPTMLMLEREPSNLDDAEHFWIDSMLAQGARLTNIAPGGLAHSQSAETRLKISRARMGMHFSAEHRAAIGKAQEGIPLSEAKLAHLKELHIMQQGCKRPAVAERMRGTNNPFFGKKHNESSLAKMSASQLRISTPEHRAKLSMAHLGKPWSLARREAYQKAYCGT